MDFHFMVIHKIAFADFEKQIQKTHKSSFEPLGSENGKVYVVAITRDGCPACEKQKPKMEKLAKEMLKKHGEKVTFTQIRVRHPTEKNAESLRSKDVLGHYFYPTNLIIVRTKDRGAIELYKTVSPRMSELKRNIELAVKIAEALT